MAGTVGKRKQGGILDESENKDGKRTANQIEYSTTARKQERSVSYRKDMIESNYEQNQDDDTFS